jgi:alpha-glucoside transport system substrate-binding protein
MAYLATAVPHEIWASYGYISPHQGVDMAVYANDLLRQEAELLQQAAIIRVDASSLMPAAPRRTFWQEMVNYVSGAPLDQVLETIDASWPATRQPEN